MKRLTPRGYALYLLKLRDRSVGEIETKLKGKGFLESEISETTEFLVEHNFLNDERFARNFVKQKLLSRQQGTHLIRQKLREKHLDNDIIELVLSELDSETELESACELSQKWLSSHSKVPDDLRWNKLGSFLVRRGYDYDKVKIVLGKILNKDNY